jgi:hypothetical protein
MSVFTLTDAYILINGVLLSDHANQVSVDMAKKEVDFTAFGAVNEVTGKGIGSGNMTMKFFQDFALGSVDATLFPLFGSTTPITVEVRATSAARSTTNPAYVMSGLLFTYSPISGSIGEASQIDAQFKNGAQTGIQRLTA